MPPLHEFEEEPQQPAGRRIQKPLVQQQDTVVGVLLHLFHLDKRLAGGLLPFSFQIEHPHVPNLVSMGQACFATAQARYDPPEPVKRWKISLLFSSMKWHGGGLSTRRP